MENKQPEENKMTYPYNPDPENKRALRFYNEAVNHDPEESGWPTVSYDWLQQENRETLTIEEHEIDLDSLTLDD